MLSIIVSVVIVTQTPRFAETPNTNYTVRHGLDLEQCNNAIRVYMRF